jgi:tRNA(Ile)-lysidine synthase TilS/MesJ
MEGYIMNFFGFGGGKSGALVKKISSTREILIIRPLIDFSKNDILKILSYLKIDDYTVDDLDIRLKNNRSLIRNKILKYLKKYNMNLLKRSSDLSVMQANLNDYSYSLNFFNFIEFKKIKCLNFYLKIPILKEIFRLGIKNSLFFLNPLVDHRLSNKKINKMINRVTLNRRKEANRSDSLNDFIFFSKGYNAKFDFSGILVNISNCILNMKIS